MCSFPDASLEAPRRGAPGPRNAHPTYTTSPAVLCARLGEQCPPPPLTHAPTPVQVSSPTAVLRTSMHAAHSPPTTPLTPSLCADVLSLFVQRSGSCSSTGACPEEAGTTTGSSSTPLSTSYPFLAVTWRPARQNCGLPSSSHASARALPPSRHGQASPMAAPAMLLAAVALCLLAAASPAAAAGRGTHQHDGHHHHHHHARQLHGSADGSSYTRCSTEDPSDADQKVCGWGRGETGAATQPRSAGAGCEGCGATSHIPG